MIDRGNDSESWPKAVVDALAGYRQGSLVPSPPFFYFANPALPIWAASRLMAEDAHSTELIELDPADSPPYGIITTQSCDVDEEGRNGKPWVQIAPVYELPPDHSELRNIVAWRKFDLAPVTALGQTWVADLRIEFPVEKGWLVTQPPRDGFTSPEEFVSFSEHCGNFRSRPGIATAIYDQILKPLERFLKEERRSNRSLYDTFCTVVEHLFLDIAGDHLNPRTVKLFFVGQDPLPDALTERLDAWHESVIVATPSLSFVLLTNDYLAFKDVQFEKRRRWLEQPLARLAGQS